MHLSGEWSPLHVHPLILTGHAWDLPQLPGEECLKWKSRQYWTPLGALHCPVLGPSVGSAPFGGLVVLATTLTRVVLEMVLVDALGLTSFLSFVLTLSFALKISRCLQLLEEHPFVDLPGPEKLVFFDGLHCGLQGGALCHELVDLPPGVPLGPQECKLRRRWSMDGP